MAHNNSSVGGSGGYSPTYDDSDPYYQKASAAQGAPSEFESDPLFYNSRPFK